MDLAGGIVAAERAGGRMVTVAVEGMKFHRPVFVGDTVSCYARITRIGRTSITVDIETVARRHHLREEVTVTEGLFTYVAVDENGRPRAVEQAG